MMMMMTAMLDDDYDNDDTTYTHAPWHGSGDLSCRNWTLVHLLVETTAVVTMSYLSL